jgi:hypothetical protein
VRGENCVPQDDSQLHKTLINFTRMKTYSAVLVWHPTDSLIEMTLEIQFITYFLTYGAELS